MLFRPESQRTRLLDLMQDITDQNANPVAAAHQLLAIDPEHAASYCVLGNAAAVAGDSAEAERLLWKGLELQPFGCMLLGSLAHLYDPDPHTAPAAEMLWVLALWAIGLSGEVPDEFRETFQTVPDPEVDYHDPVAYCLMAEQHEEELKPDAIPPALDERIRPYWLLKEVARGALGDFSPGLLRQIQAESAACVPVLYAALHAWARNQGDTSDEALPLIVALLGELAGPEVLPDLWELSNLRDNAIFLHAHWAICRMAVRYPAETIDSIHAAIANAATGLRCGMAEHLGLMPKAEGAAAAIVALMKDFAQRAKDDDAPYLLLASADALSQIGSAARAKELFAQYDRLLTKEGRRWMRETIDQPEGFVPRIVEEELPDLDIEDICLGGALIDDEEGPYDDDEEDEEFDDGDEDEDFEAPDVAAPKPGRNDPCWCGSGKKYKKCHLEADEAAAREEFEEPHEHARPLDPARAEAMEGLLSTAERVHKRRDMMEAARQYFGDDMEEENMEEGSEDFFLWYLFDFRQQSTGRTAVEEHLRKHGDRISPEAREVLEAWRDSRYGLFEAVKALGDGSVELKDLYAGDTMAVHYQDGSDEVEPGGYVLARLEKWGGRVMFCADPTVVEPEHLTALQKFVQTEIMTTGQTPAEFVRTNAHRLHRVLEDLYI